jgi:hypothetical protein
MYPARLLPEGFTGWRLDTADDYVSYFTLGVTSNNVDFFLAAHSRSK